MGKMLAIQKGTKAEYAIASKNGDTLYIITDAEDGDVTLYLGTRVLSRIVSLESLGAAPENHGNHVPETEISDNARYLRNDNTWHTITPDNIGAATSGHTHDYIDIYNGHATGTLTTQNIVIASGYELIYGTTQTMDTQGRLWTARYNDLAEWMNKVDSSEIINPGHIVSFGKNGKVTKATIDNKNLIAGVYSDTWAHVLGGHKKARKIDDNYKYGFIPIGIDGRVKVLAKGNIKPGDLLTISDEPGIAKRADIYEPGTIIGKAIGSHRGNNLKRIPMMIWKC